MRKERFGIYDRSIDNKEGPSRMEKQARLTKMFTRAVLMTASAFILLCVTPAHAQAIDAGSCA